MAKGDGSVVEVRRRDGRSYRPKHWKVRIDRGKDPVTSKRRTPITKTITGTKADACRVRDQLRTEMLAGLQSKVEPTTFKVFATQWHESREATGNLSKTRLVRVKGILDLLDKYLGNLRIPDITPQVIDNVIACIRKDKIEERGAYSNTSLDMIFKVLRQVLEKAVDY